MDININYKFLFIILFIYILYINTSTNTLTEGLTQSTSPNEALENLSSLYNNKKIITTNLKINDTANLHDVNINENLNVTGNITSKGNLTVSQNGTINEKLTVNEINAKKNIKVNGKKISTLNIIEAPIWNFSKFIEQIKNGNYFQMNDDDGKLLHFVFHTPDKIKWWFIDAVKFGNQFFTIRLPPEHICTDPWKNNSTDLNWRGNIIGSNN